MNVTLHSIILNVTNVTENDIQEDVFIHSEYRLLISMYSIYNRITSSISSFLGWMLSYLKLKSKEALTFEDL